MEVKVLGTGCAKCDQLLDVTETAVAQAGVDAEVQKVEDVESIVAHGVMMTPALVIDGKVLSAGKVPDTSEVVAWLTTAAS